MSRAVRTTRTTGKRIRAVLCGAAAHRSRSRVSYLRQGLALPLRGTELGYEDCTQVTFDSNDLGDAFGVFIRPLPHLRVAWYAVACFAFVFEIHRGGQVVHWPRSDGSRQCCCAVRCVILPRAIRQSHRRCGPAGQPIDNGLGDAEQLRDVTIADVAQRVAGAPSCAGFALCCAHADTQR